MSPTPTDIRDYALGLIDSYGPHSLHYADEMIQAYLANGNTGALDVWRRVRQELLNMAADGPSRATEARMAAPAVALAE